MDSRLATQYQQSARLQPNGRSSSGGSSVDIQLSANIPAYRGKRSDFIPHARAAARQPGVEPQPAAGEGVQQLGAAVVGR